MSSTLDTSARPSLKATEAMLRFDASRQAVLRRTRNEGLVALSASVVLTLAALPFFKPASSSMMGATNDTAATLTCMLLSTGLVMACVSVIRIFQSATYASGNRLAAAIDHFAIMWATGYVAWLLYGLGAAWQ